MTAPARAPSRPVGGHAGETTEAGTAGCGFTPRFFSASDGLRLYARDYRPEPRRNGFAAAPPRLPVVCLAGLTRNSRDFHRLALFLSRHPEAPRRVVTFDYRGRGQSARDSTAANYALPVETDDVLAGMAALGLADAAFIGTSRGALIIHMLAAARPGVLSAAILNDAGPVIEGAGLAQIKGYLERMPAPRDWTHAADVLKTAHGRSFPALDDGDWSEMARAVFTEKSGRIVSDYDPALVRMLGAIDFNTRLPTLWPQFDGLAHVPLMTVRGETSSLLAAKTVAAMAKRHPGMRVVEAAGQGHPPLLHRDGIDAAIADFLVAAAPD